MLSTIYHFVLKKIIPIELSYWDITFIVFSIKILFFDVFKVSNLYGNYFINDEEIDDDINASMQ